MVAVIVSVAVSMTSTASEFLQCDVDARAVGAGPDAMRPEAVVVDLLDEVRVAAVAAEDERLVETTDGDVGVRALRLVDELRVVRARPGVHDLQDAHPSCVNDGDLAGERVSQPQLAAIGRERLIGRLRRRSGDALDDPAVA